MRYIPIAPVLVGVQTRADERYSDTETKEDRTRFEHRCACCQKYDVALGVNEFSAVIRDGIQVKYYAPKLRTNDWYKYTTMKTVWTVSASRIVRTCVRVSALHDGRYQNGYICLDPPAVSEHSKSAQEHYAM